MLSIVRYIAKIKILHAGSRANCKGDTRNDGL